MLRKEILYLRHVIRMVFCNRLRLFLSVGGLFVGLLILTVGNIFLESYYSDCMGKAESFSEYSLLLEVSAEKENLRLVKEFMGEPDTEFEMCELATPIFSRTYTNNRTCSMKTFVVGVTDMRKAQVLCDYSKPSAIPTSGKLLEGRFINLSDSAEQNRVVVIDKLSADIMFGDDSPIGHKIYVDANGAFVRSDVTDSRIGFEIVGVFEQERATAENHAAYRRFVAQEKEDLVLDMKAYIPETCFRELFSSSDAKLMYCWKEDNAKAYKGLLAKAETCKKVFEGRCPVFRFSTREEVVSELHKEMKPLRLFLWMILGLLILVSGVCSMNIMFFAVKERMEEIGIKKAMGATRADLILQFLLEGIVTAYIAMIPALLVGSGIALLLGDYVREALLSGFPILITSKTVLTTVIVASLYGVLFSLFPSCYGANANAVEMLRFE